MVIYKITVTGPQGFRVTAVSSDGSHGVIGDFSTLQDAEAFADSMRVLDAGLTSRSTIGGGV